MPIIKMISDKPERYNIQGFGLPAQFEPGEFYNVPEHVAKGMMDPTRNWARLATRDDVIPAELPQADDLPQTPVHDTMPPDQAQSVEPPPTEPPTDEAVHPASPAGRKSRSK